MQFLGTAAAACLYRFIAVFYSEIGVSRQRIGVLQFLGPLAAFMGQFFWAAVIDRRAEYKWTFVSTTFAGTCITFLHLLPAVQESYPFLVGVTVAWNLLLCTGGPVVDALCLTVLAEQNLTEEDYGDQRLWCAVGWGGMSLVAGQMIDWLGVPFMFVGFAAIQALNLLICVVCVRSKPDHAAAPSAGRPSGLSLGRSLCCPEVAWFFLNLLQYGVAMSLVENFLLVFLLEDFLNTSKVLLGASVAVMCASEVPVFKFTGRLWSRYGVSLASVITFCQGILALRCVLYTLLPPGQPWLVLLVEPLHGITFAAMWTATVEYGQRLAPPGTTAQVQALVNGIYEQAAMGLGSLVWGSAMAEPPRGLGFRGCFLLDAAAVVGWSAVCRLGHWAVSRRGSR